MISFIVPAHNEEKCLKRTLPAIHESARAVGHPYEIIVVNDASTDATAEVARQHHARVIDVNHRKIAATRNSGGRAALGDRLVFVDADTTINPKAVFAAMRAMDKGAVGGGAAARLDDGMVPLYIRLISCVAVPICKSVGFTGGAFMFCTREAFRATGGFNERLYWSEEGAFALALKREGRFVVLWQSVLTSGRRFRQISGLQILIGGIRMIFSPIKMFTRRTIVQKVWYDSDRTQDENVSRSMAVRVSNGIALLILVVVVTEPFWGRIPWTFTPLTSSLGKVRFLIQSMLCHVGLLFWPLGGVLFVNVLRQKRWTGLVHSTALIAFLWWQAWGATRGVVRGWNWISRWLTDL